MRASTVSPDRSRCRLAETRPGFLLGGDDSWGDNPGPSTTSYPAQIALPRSPRPPANPDCLAASQGSACRTRFANCSPEASQLRARSMLSHRSSVANHHLVLTADRAFPVAAHPEVSHLAHCGLPEPGQGPGLSSASPCVHITAGEAHGAHRGSQVGHRLGLRAAREVAGESELRSRPARGAGPGGVNVPTRDVEEPGPVAPVVLGLKLLSPAGGSAEG